MKDQEKLNHQSVNMQGIQALLKHKEEKHHRIQKWQRSTAGPSAKAIAGIHRRRTHIHSQKR